MVAVHFSANCNACLISFVRFAATLVLLLAIPVGRCQGRGTLKGIVTDQFDEGLSDALVSLYSPDRVLHVTSDKIGRFDFTNVPSGTYELVVSREGFQARTFDRIRIPEMDTEAMSISLPIANPGSDCGRAPAPTYGKLAAHQPVLLGVLRDYARGPVAGFKVRLLKADSTQIVASQRSNEKGEFQFRDVQPGRYLVRASRKSWTAQSQIFWITRENITRIILDPLKRGSIILCQ
jgi:Carboxypeptidase regulatory-like domain